MADRELRALHWNVHSWRDRSGASNLEAVVNQIQATEPHAVSLVEVDEPWDERPSLRNVADRCGYSWIFPPAFEYGQDKPGGGFGNALLVNLPILAVQHRQLLWPPRVYDRTEESESRSIVLARVSFLGVPLWVGSTHLPRGDSTARTYALRRLGELLRELDDPWLVCGDFNTPAASWVDSAGAFEVSPLPAQNTYPAAQPTEPIDYCIASPGSVLNGEALTSPGSDHRPVLVMSQVSRRLPEP